MKNEKIECVKKSEVWLKNAVGLSEKEIQEYRSNGFPALYCYDRFTPTKGDFIEIRCFKTKLPDHAIQQLFEKTKFAFNPVVCEVLL